VLWKYFCVGRIFTAVWSRLAFKGKRLANPGADQARPADQRAGVRFDSWLSVRRFNPGKTAARHSLTGTSSRRQDSTTERIAATFGPACALPTCSQFLRPSATGRIEFSARLLDSSTSP
jgi:hypothetical protein